MDEQRTEEENEKCNYAALRSCRTPGEPVWAANGSVEETADAEKATVGRAIEEGFCPIPSRMEADGKPEITGASNGEAEQQAGLDNLQNSECVFPGFTEMGYTKHCREKQSRGPETPAF